MAEDDDDSFGDFTSASFPPNAPQSTIEDDDDDDDEWGDFLDFSPGSNQPSQTKPFHGSQHPVQSTPLSEPATTQTDSSKTAQWVKPRGALPLSLFGEAEDDEEDKSAHIQTKKLSNGSNTHIIASLYNHSPQFQSGKPSLHASEYGNLSSNLGISELGLNSGLLDVRNDFGTVHNFDCNFTGSGSKSQAVESTSDLNKLLSDQTGFSSNTSVDVTNLSERSERIKSDDSLIGSTTGGLSSDITASRLSFSGWGFDFGEFGSASKTSNSSFSGLNSNSDAIVVSESYGEDGDKEEEEDDDDDDDGWEFKDSFTEASDGGTHNKVNAIGSNHKGALPLSIFGDEELETDASSTVEDGLISHLTSFPKIDKKQEPVISINDLISSLYSQAEHTSSISSLQNLSDAVEPPDSGASSNLVNDEDAFEDESWEYKGGIPQGTENKTSIFHHGDSLPSSLSIRKLDNYVDFYSELKKELSLYSKYHVGNLQEAGKELDLEGYICEEDDLEGHPSWETCFHEFIEALRKPKFQVLESEYNLSRRLSQMENDFNSAVELLNHASIMLRLLTFASAKEQLNYVSVWYKVFSVCTQELKHGTWLWKQISDNDAQSYVFSNTRGRQYILGLVEIYKVAVVLGASVKLYQPWTWLNSVDFTGIYSLLDECHALWSKLGLEQAILNTSDPASTVTIRLSLDNIKPIHDLDAFSLQDHIFSQKEVICRLSLLTSEVVNGMKLVIWNGEHYFVTLANLWANLISNDPPELPHLSFGW